MAAAATPRRGLGRGLSSLLGEETPAAPQAAPQAGTAGTAGAAGGVRHLPVEFLRPGKYQPRKYMDDAGIDELARSIEEKGILQPLLVRRLEGETEAFEIIAGERRWRAAQRAKVHEVPVLVKDLSDEEVLEVALIENLQRQDLSALEEAEGYRRLMEEFRHTQEDLAKVVGKSRSHVANMMRLLGLPDTVKTLLAAGALSAGHARALLNAKEPMKLAKKVVNRGLSVRQTEKLVQKEKDQQKPTRAISATAKDANTLSLERDLTNLLGLKTEIKFHGEGGSITIHYGSLDQLDDILLRLSHGHATPVTSDSATRETAPDPTDELQTFETSLSTEDLRTLLTPDDTPEETKESDPAEPVKNEP
ncbi:MAG: ParB/RepB/Spo0J family partition protein [Rhodospirillales bacterium]